MSDIYGIILLIYAFLNIAFGPAILRRLCKKPMDVGDQRRFGLYLRILVAVGDALLFLRMTLNPSTIVAFLLWTVVTQAMMVDIWERRVPNPLIGIALLLGLPLLLFLHPFRMLPQLIAMTGFFLSLGVLAILPAGMGMGDAKLAAVIGLFLGIDRGIVALLIGFLLGGAYSVSLLALRKGNLRSTFPFAPFLAFGGLFALLIHPFH